jgi:alpha-mannosidase
MVTLSGWRLLELDNPRILLSALKKSEWGEELVLRLYNPTPRQESCTLTLGIDVSRVRKLSLLEEEEEILPLAGKTISLEFGPWEIKTLGILPA